MLLPNTDLSLSNFYVQQLLHSLRAKPSFHLEMMEKGDFERKKEEKGCSTMAGNGTYSITSKWNNFM